MGADQLLYWIVNKSKTRCNVRSISLYIGYITSVQGEKKLSTWRADCRLFLKQRDHLVLLPPAKLFYQSSYCWCEGEILVDLHFFSLALDKICVSWVIKNIACERRNKLSL